MDDRRQQLNPAGVAAIPAVTSSTPPPPPAPPAPPSGAARMAKWQERWTEIFRFAIDQAGKRP